jgi:hypothetical protein
MTETQPVGECMAYDLTTGALPLPGGMILRSDAWTVEQLHRPSGLRHSVGQTDSARPARSGPHGGGVCRTGPALLTRVSRTVSALLNPEQVCVCLKARPSG